MADSNTPSDAGRIVTRLKEVSSSSVYLILLWVAAALAGSWGTTWGWGYLSAADRHREVLIFSLGLLNVVVLGSIAALLLENFKSGQTQALRVTNEDVETIRQFVAKAHFKFAFSSPYHEAIAMLNGTNPQNTASDT